MKNLYFWLFWAMTILYWADEYVESRSKNHYIKEYNTDVRYLLDQLHESTANFDTMFAISKRSMKMSLELIGEVDSLNQVIKKLRKENKKLIKRIKHMKYSIFQPVGGDSNPQCLPMPFEHVATIEAFGIDSAFMLACKGEGLKRPCAIGDIILLPVGKAVMVTGSGFQEVPRNYIDQNSIHHISDDARGMVSAGA